MPLVHYIIVRRDISLGDVVAQVTHAAGESFFKKAWVAPRFRAELKRESADTKDACSSHAPGSSFAERPIEGSSIAERREIEDGASQTPPRPIQIAGSSSVERHESGDGTSQVPPRANETVAVVLGARNEHRLKKLEQHLLRANIPHVAIRESEGKYSDQLMAIGLLPDFRENILPKVPYLNEFHMLKECGGCEIK